jgi:hypothetical protein
LPIFGVSDIARANCVNPGQEAAVAAAQQASSSEPVVVELNTCGGDDTSYQVPLSVSVTFDGQVFDRVYATTNSVITFGRPDGTYWDYPQTPSISLYSFDWVVYPGWRSDEHLIIRSSDGGFQVDMSARPIWMQNATEPTNIVITAAILSDGTVAMAYTLTGPEYPQGNPRTGVRLNDGTVVTFEQYGIQETEETPTLSPEPTEEAPFTPEPEPTQSPEPTPTPTPEPEPLVLNAPTNITATQLSDGSVQIIWNEPSQSNTVVESYAVSWSTDNFQSNSWGVGSSTNSIVLSRDAFSSSGGLDQTYQFRVRSDNNTSSVYSSFSDTASLTVVSPPPPPPTVPDGATVSNEGSVIEVVAPEGKRIANALGFYGDPNDSTRGMDVSSILFQLLAGSTSATIEVSNDTFQNDPARGTPKILILLITYEDIPVEPTPEPTPTPTPEPSVQPTPEATQPPVVEPSPEPTPEPSVTPSPEPTPSPLPSPEPPVAPEPQPSTPVVPEPEPSQEPSPEPTTEPEPEETSQPETPTTEPVKPSPEPSPSEPTPPIVEPEEESITSAEELPEELSADQLMNVDLEQIDPDKLSEAQVEAIEEAAMAIFETAEQGSEEYSQALEALMLVAQSDDIELPSELAAIPLLGDVAGAALELFNNLGNVGSDMSPQVRETAEDIVVVSVVVAQVVGVSAISAMSSTSIRKP